MGSRTVRNLRNVRTPSNPTPAVPQGYHVKLAHDVQLVNHAHLGNLGNHGEIGRLGNPGTHGKPGKRGESGDWEARQVISGASGRSEGCRHPGFPRDNSTGPSRHGAPGYMTV